MSYKYIPVLIVPLYLSQLCVGEKLHFSCVNSLYTGLEASHDERTDKTSTKVNLESTEWLIRFYLALWLDDTRLS